MARDTLDRNLIALLQANARESTANLARKLGVARTTVLARLARLERDGVVWNQIDSYHPSLDDVRAMTTSAARGAVRDLSQLKNK